MSRRVASIDFGSGRPAMSVFTINDDGTVSAINNQYDIGSVLKRERFSHIRPVNPLLRWAFIVIRNCCGEKGLGAAFTRIWPCEWEAQVIETGKTKRSRNRQELIEWEIEQYFNPLGEL